eukprot:352382_1
MSHSNSLTVEDDTHIQTDDGNALKRIANILKQYQFIISNSKAGEYNISQSIIKYMTDIDYTNLVNDYHHILTEYSFDAVHESIKHQVICDIRTCKSYQRNCRDLSVYQSTEQKHDKNYFYLNILDNIHTFFVHGYDIGFRIHYTEQRSAFNSLFREKQADLMKIRGQNRMIHNKFYTEISSDTSSLSEQVESKSDHDKTFPSQVQNDNSFNGEEMKYQQQLDEDIGNNENEIQIGQYSFGQRLYYWNYFKNKNEKDPFNPGYTYKDWYITKKYAKFKEEILNKIDVNRYNESRDKAIQLLKNSEKLKALQSREISEYRIRMKQAFEYHYLMSIIFYTDYGELSYTFSATFRKMPSESDASMKKRNSAFWNWAKLLITTVHAFGNRLNYLYGEKINALYHGVTFMYFNSFAARFCSPTSTTCHAEVAAMFASPEGIVLSLENCPDDYPFYFNASLVSRFGIENERLFIAGNGVGSINPGLLRFIGIRIMASGDDFSTAVRALSYLDIAITGKKIPYERDPEVFRIITKLIEGTYYYPQYIVEIFKRFTTAKKFIKINFCQIRAYAPESFNDIFVNRFDRDQLLQFDKICKIFINCQEIECNMLHASPISISYFSRLTNKLLQMDRKVFPRLQKIKLTNITHSIVINTAPFLSHLEKQNKRLNWHCSHQISQLIFIRKHKEFTSSKHLLPTTQRVSLHTKLLVEENDFEESQEINEKEIARELILADNYHWFISDSIAMLLHNVCYYMFVVTILLEMSHYKSNLILLWMSRCGVVLCIFETILFTIQTFVFCGKIKRIQILTTIPNVQILLEYFVNLPMMIIQTYYLYCVLQDSVLHGIVISECIAFVAYICYIGYKIMIIFCHHHATWKYYATWEIRDHWHNMIRLHFLNWGICVSSIMIGFGAAFLDKNDVAHISFVLLVMGICIFIITLGSAVASYSNLIEPESNYRCVCSCCIDSSESAIRYVPYIEYRDGYSFFKDTDEWCLFAMNLMGLVLHNTFYYLFAINICTDFMCSDSDQTLSWISAASLLCCALETIFISIGFLQLLLLCFKCRGFACCDLEITTSILQFTVEYVVNLPMVAIMIYYRYYIQWNADIYEVSIYFYFGFGSYIMHVIYKICLLVYARKKRQHWDAKCACLINLCNWVLLVPLILVVFGVTFIIIGNHNNDHIMSIVLLVSGLSIPIGSWICFCVLAASGILDYVLR